ncbi:MAG: hypothetical protein JNK85_03295 [Verrucomicrobiales bacterium]|nr:hypothetical protein [Verrucomicrobiales bacterium]
MTTRHPRRDAKIRIVVSALLTLSALLVATQENQRFLVGGLFLAASYAMLPAGSLNATSAVGRPSALQRRVRWVGPLCCLALAAYYLLLAGNPLPAWVALLLAAQLLISTITLWREVSTANEEDLQNAFAREELNRLP